MSGFPSKSEMFATFPSEWPEDLMPAIRAQLAVHPAKVVVLDDDPTGTQTVHGIPVLTEWSREFLAAVLREPGPGFYILTNSRAFPVAEACAINREIGSRLAAEAAHAGVRLALISRSDSTLRGHFPDEVEALAGSSPVLLCPFFEAGGRFTLGDIHYVAEGDSLIPAAATPFARDVVFGFRSSNLREWVVEKSQGRISADQIDSLSLDDIRTRGPQFIADQILRSTARVLVANAACQRDMEVIVLASLIAEQKGKKLIHRTAASFVATRMGLEPRRPLTASDLSLEAATGGLILAGSYVPKTTAQLEALLATGNACPVELSVPALLSDQRQSAIDVALATLTESLTAGRDTVVFTSRALITGADAAESLGIGRRVSEALVELVTRLEVHPRFLIAKGGITSSDLATRGLGVRRAMVRGQVFPGVPVWELGAETRFPGLPYIVFPGNVGGPNALAEVVRILSKS